LKSEAALSSEASEDIYYPTECKNPEECNLFWHVHRLMKFWRQKHIRKHELRCNQALHYSINPWHKTNEKLFRARQVYLFIFFYVTRRFIAALTTADTNKVRVLVNCTVRKPVGILAEALSVITRIYVALHRPPRKISEHNLRCRIDHDRFHILSILSVTIHPAIKLIRFLQHC